MEKIVSEMVIADMKGSLDPSQYGNQKHISIQHYLVRLLNRVITSMDRNGKGEVNAVLCMFIDWKQAYSRQCHTLGSSHSSGMVSGHQLFRGQGDES